jgi:hypothetical protein
MLLNEITANSFFTFGINAAQVAEIQLTRASNKSPVLPISRFFIFMGFLNKFSGEI